MALDTGELRSQIYKRYKSQAAFSRDIGWDCNKINRVLLGAAIPDINDCAEIAKVLSMSPKEYYKVFLPELSPFGDKDVS